MNCLFLALSSSKVQWGVVKLYKNMLYEGGHILNNFRFNLKGQLNEVKLPEYKALWPLFETIVNSIQSIEESTNSQNGQITILANRLEDRQVNMDGNEELNPFCEFQVIDNGEGFNSINYNSFLEAYSNLKVSKGCKGIGRFLWLKAFTKVNIESVYCEKNRWLKRKLIRNQSKLV